MFYKSVIAYWLMVLLSSSISLLIFLSSCSIAKKVVFEVPTTNFDSYISPFNIISFCFTNFSISLVHTLLKLQCLLGRLTHLSLCNVSSHFFNSESPSFSDWLYTPCATYWKLLQSSVLGQLLVHSPHLFPVIQGWLYFIAWWL